MAKDKTPPKAEAQVDLTVRMVPPLKCQWYDDGGGLRGCGKGMQPIVERWRKRADDTEYACCKCKLCGRSFIYYPANDGAPPQIRGIVDADRA
jgi:hypothetical protein